VEVKIRNTESLDLEMKEIEFKGERMLWTSTRFLLDQETSNHQLRGHSRLQHFFLKKASKSFNSPEENEPIPEPFQ
jgi:hypothetical protein